MAQIKTRRFVHTGKSGEKLEFNLPINVNHEGTFHLTMPEELIATAHELAGADEWRRHVHVDKQRVHTRAEARVLERLEHFMDALLKVHLACEETRELVIVYGYSNQTSFSRAQDGSMHPNGHFAGEGAEWAGNPKISAQYPPRAFAVGVTARVYEKVTFTRPSGSRVVYERPRGDHWAVNAITRLNGFILSDPRDQRDNFFDRGLPITLSEMPYSEQAANFFTDMMLAMCRLGEQLDQFLGDKEQLALAIDRGALLLPNGTAKAAP